MISIADELSKLYSHFITGGSNPLTNVNFQYADYAAWQREQFIKDDQIGLPDYWKSELAGIPDVQNLPLDRPRPQKNNTDTSKFFLTADSSERLKKCRHAFLTLRLTSY